MQTTPIDALSVQDFISKVVLHLNISMTALGDFHKNMESALKTIGEFSHHDRIHILAVNNNMTYTIQHEWCSPHLTPLEDRHKHNMLFYDPALEQQLCDRNYIKVRLKDDHSNPALQALLKTENCKQMLVLPLFESGFQFAFIVFMQCQDTHDWSMDELRMLQDISSVIATQLNNYYLIKHLVHRIKKYQKQQQPVELFFTQIKQLHAGLMPTWQEVKKWSENSGVSSEEFILLERHIITLDKLCRPLSEKH